MKSGYIFAAIVRLFKRKGDIDIGQPKCCLSHLHSTLKKEEMSSKFNRNDSKTNRTA